MKLELTKEQIRDVWKKYKKTGKRQYRNILIEHYLPVVEVIANTLKKKLPRCVDTEDLKSSGIFGLINAIDLFDLKRGIKFETYSFNRIRGSMLDELRKMDWVPRRVRVQKQQLTEAYSKAEKKLNRMPNRLEVASELKISIKAYNDMEDEASARTIFSFNREIPNDNNDLGFFDLIQDGNADKEFRQIPIRDITGYIKEKLSERERKIIELYLYDNLTMNEISKMLGIHQTRISQLFSGAINRIQYQFKGRQHEWLA